MARPKEKNKDRVPVREPQKRTPSGIFDNLRQLPHPVEEILGLNPVVGTHHQESFGTHQGLESPIEIEVPEKPPAAPELLPTELKAESDRQNISVGTHRDKVAGTHPYPQVGTNSKVLMGTPPTSMVGTFEEPVGTMVPTTEALVGTMVPTKITAGTHHARAYSSRPGDRHAPNREQFKIRPDPEILKQVKQFCVTRKITYQEFFERASVHYLDLAGTHQEGEVGTMVPHDDMMIFKTHDDIIMLYRNLTGNRWKPADDRAATRFNDSDRRLIEIGITNTLLNARGKKINSFAYFIPEIDEALAVKLSDETIEIMLPRRRAQWDKMRQGKAK